MVLRYVSKAELREQIGAAFPCSDTEAWLAFPEQRHLYNKMYIAQSQALRHAPVGVWPQELEQAGGEISADLPYPIIVKPICNLFGMGTGAVRVTRSADYRALFKRAGCFWSEFLHGDFLSVDCVLARGEPLWWAAFRAEPTHPWSGAFDHFASLPEYAPPDWLRDWLRRELRGYTGCVNVEVIGQRIIECHLRMGDLNQFLSVPLFRQLADVYAERAAVVQYRVPQLYLVPVFVPADVRTQPISNARLLELCADALMVQRDPPPDCSSPEGFVRLFNLTVRELSVGLTLRRQLWAALLG